MIYYIFYKFLKYKTIKIPDIFCIPLLGVAPMDPRVWPLEAREGLTKGPRYPFRDGWTTDTVIIRLVNPVLLVLGLSLATFYGLISTMYLICLKYIF